MLRLRWLGVALLASACEPQCADKCANLNGNVQAECGDCPASSLCNPEADDFGVAATTVKAIVPPTAQPTVMPPSPPSHVEDELSSVCPSYPLGIDRASFESEYCAEISDRAGSGVAVVRGAIEADELIVLNSLFDEIPYPNRYLCGHSDDVYWTPSECLHDAEMLLRRLPKLYARVREAIGKRPLLAQENGQHEMVRINNLEPWPRRNVTVSYSELKALAQDVEGRNGYQRSRLFTEATGAPFFDGLHWWHRDRQGGRLGKLWLMTWRTGGGDSANQTGLAVVPKDAYERYVGPSNFLDLGDASACRLAANNFSPDTPSILDELSCTINVEPGDAVYYSNLVWHRSQDALNDREALSMDVTEV